MPVSIALAGIAAALGAVQPAHSPIAGDTPRLDASNIDAGPESEIREPASTALKLREVDTRMTVAVTINGAGPFRFIVDSGATRTVISRALATALGLPAAGTVALHSVGGESAVASVRIDALKLGDLPAQAIVAPVLDAADLGGAGILGIDALADKKVVIDITAHRMTIEPADRHERPPANDEIVVVARRRSGQLVLADADAAGQNIYAIVDTGSMVTIGNLVLRDRLVRRRRIDPKPTQIYDVTGRTIEAHFAPLSALRLGGWQLHNVTIAFSDAHAFGRFGLAQKPAMLLGMDMMGAFRRVSIDFRRKTLRLTRV